jgi:S1-C subfamily serine protease
MIWIRIAASAAAALTMASYAAAAPSEALLGQPLKSLRGTPAPATGAAKGFAPVEKGPAARFRQALDRLQPEAAAATRGAGDAQVYRRASPAVVLVVTEEGLGSGSLITADGEIVTNLHVVAGAKQIGVVFKPALDGAQIQAADVRRAKVLKIDEIADLALLKIDDVPAGVQPIALGDSTRLQVGADVHAIGHPTGETWTYTRGVVSQVRRAYDWTAEDKVPHEATVIQTQTPINPGNSGGPLLDAQARLVGVNSFGRDGEGLNYAVSVEDVKSFLARGHDRAAPVAAKQDCERKILRTEAWTDPKGTAELLDMDCDGEGDAVMVTAANRRNPDMLLVQNAQGDIDTIYFDANHDGHPEWAVYDTDGDGKPDLRGEFRKNEDEPYRWEKISR